MNPANTATCPDRNRPCGIATAVVLAARSVLAGVWLFVSLLILIPLAALARLADPRQRVYDHCARIWARGILRILGIRVVTRGTEHLTQGERYIVAANHQGYLDIPTLIVVLQPTLSLRFVAKRPLFFIPVLGWGMYWFGHVAIHRHGVHQARSGLLRAQEDVQRRWSVVFFPEGSRTYTGALGNFKKGAFHAAARAGVRVLPVTIIGSWDKLPRQKRVLLSWGTIEVVVHSPLAAPGEAPHQVQAASEACRRQIEAALATAP
jgi:1-acyl-sn-glycerol-3-phosphate acyltransferase